MGLEGTIAKEIGNLSFLRFLDISNNSINGVIPSEIGLLRKLQSLNLSNNYLRGEIPTNLSACVELKIFDLSHNNLRGTVPAGFGNWSQLEDLSLSRNYLTGQIPVSIGNLSNLEVLDISKNSFYGIVVSEMGRLSSLRILNLQENNLSGEVPQIIFNLSMLQFLSLRENNLSGTLPFSIDRGLPNIEQIFIGNIDWRFNLRASQFYGKIPNSISNLSKLFTLDLSDNSFTHVPLNLGNLHQLQMLNLQANQFMNNLSNPSEDFLFSLAACKNLKSIQISLNPITGVLPKSLGSSNLSSSLETLKASSCRLSSPIPDEIGNLSNLLWLNLGYNYFTGAIPLTLGRLRSLRNLEIYGNRFRGSISPLLCNLDKLYSLNLAVNNLAGQLPSCLGNLSLLREMDMSDNEFNANIASILWFRKGVSNVKNLVALDLSKNKLSGKIPSTISKFENLVRLSLSRNILKGRIVESFTVLKDLQFLDLSHNNLSGSIPKSLEALPHLAYFDVSFNELRGKIPDRGCFVNFTAEFFIGNNGLCGSPRFKVKKCQSLSVRKRILYLSLLIFPVIGLIDVLLWIFFARRLEKPSSVDCPSGIVDCPSGIFAGISYKEILCATGNLENLIGKGGNGSVYRTKSSNMVYAVKVYNLTVTAALKSFHTECEILGRVRHRNLVKVVSLYSQDNFKALLMTYMPKGDLERWLHSSGCSLDLSARLRILQEVACAVEYLHEYSLAPIVHCDLKPKNILLDEDMVAHVGDFGSAKILKEEEQMLCSGTLGTVGYIAPEYGSQGLISTAVDVYSYGILLMEMLSGRRPTDEMFSGELTLRGWVSESFPDSVLQIVDNELQGTNDEDARAALATCSKWVIGLALECTADLPGERPNMRDVHYMIKMIADPERAGIHKPYPLVWGCTDVPFPLMMPDRKWVNKFEQWYEANRLDNNTEFLKNIPFVGQRKASWFEEIWCTDGWLLSDHIDCIVTMHISRSMHWPNVFVKNWTTIQNLGWAMISNHDHVVRDLFKPYVEGSLPAALCVPWSKAEHIVSIGWIKPDHWVCYEIKLEEQRVIVYDSLSKTRDPTIVLNAFKPALKNLAWMCLECNVWKYRQPKAKLREEWELTIYRDPPQQGNTSNCGVLSLKFMECLLTGNPVSILHPDYMYDLRKQYCASIYRVALEGDDAFKSLV